MLGILYALRVCFVLLLAPSLRSCFHAKIIKPAQPHVYRIYTSWENMSDWRVRAIFGRGEGITNMRVSFRGGSIYRVQFRRVIHAF